MKNRIKACLSQRHNAEALGTMIVLMIVQALIELHKYALLAPSSVFIFGLRDMMLAVFFAADIELSRQMDSARPLPERVTDDA